MKNSITFVLPNLKIGGAELANVQLANYFYNNGYEVRFILTQEIGPLIKKLPKDVLVECFFKKRFFQTLFLFYRFIKTNPKTCLVVSLWPLTVIVSLAKLISNNSAKLLLWEHCVLSEFSSYKKVINRMLINITARIFYQTAYAVIAPSQAVADDICKYSGLSQDRISVIPNPAYKDKINAIKPLTTEFRTWAKSKIKLISVGNLSPIKNHKLLVDALSKLPHNLDFSLILLGEGACRTELEKQIKQMQLQNKVFLAGQVVETEPYYEIADLFVLSSDSEGFSNVIVEALSFGLSVVSTDCGTGPREILLAGQYGRLVSKMNSSALAHAIEQELNSPTSTKEKRIHRAKEYSSDVIGEKFRKLLEN